MGKAYNARTAEGLYVQFQEFYIVFTYIPFQD